MKRSCKNIFLMVTILIVILLLRRTLNNSHHDSRNNLQSFYSNNAGAISSTDVGVLRKSFTAPAITSIKNLRIMAKHIRNCIVCQTPITAWKYCPDCRKATLKKYFAAKYSTERCADYYARNREKINERCKNNYRKRKEEFDIKYFLKRDEYYNSETYHTKVIDEFLNRCKSQHEWANQQPLNYKIYLRTIQFLTPAIFNNTSKKRAESTLGCSVEFYKKYLEGKFTDGMNWDNRGLLGWHIDHIISCDKFNLSDKDEFQKAFHYTNTQPLWNVDNVRKAKGFFTSSNPYPVSDVG